jgi:hypothetical protein
MRGDLRISVDTHQVNPSLEERSSWLSVSLGEREAEREGALSLQHHNHTQGEKHMTVPSCLSGVQRAELEELVGVCICRGRELSCEPDRG